MKKIMTALAAITLAASVQAAAFNWKTAATGRIYQAGTTTLLASGTAYLFDSAAVTQQDVLTAVLGGSSLGSLTSLSSSSVSDGKISSTSFNWGNAGDELNAFVAIVDGDKVYIGVMASATGDASASAVLSLKERDSSQLAAKESSTFTSAGWYTAAAVPEPTSGLLMLVGLAGLALRRRRT